MQGRGAHSPVPQEVSADLDTVGPLGSWALGRGGQSPHISGGPTAPGAPGLALSKRTLTKKASRGWKHPTHPEAAMGAVCTCLPEGIGQGSRVTEAPGDHCARE